jgi:peptidyl-prolyl cis-trans isomerase A (cyclophilin A)
MNKPGKTFLLTLALFTGFLSSCNAKSNKTEQNEGMTTTETPAPSTDWKKQPGLYAEIVTSKGSIVIALEYQKAPVTVANFVGLAEGKIDNQVKPAPAPFYNGLTFHRCIHSPQPFMIQGGDPAGNGSGGPGYKFGDEFVYGLKFDKVGLLAMANSGPATNGSQFFITEAATPWLDYKHTIFGSVVEGYNLVSQINDGEVMTKVNIVRVGKEAEAFDAVATWAKKDELLRASAAAFQAAKTDAEKIYTVSADELVKKQYPTAKKTASGLYYIIEREGTGAQAAAGKSVSVHYTGTLADGKKFDSSLDRGQPITFVLGQGQVIKGWDEGIALMKVGSKIKLIIPYNLAYGDQGFPPVIPAKATLIFDTELMDVK